MHHFVEELTRTIRKQARLRAVGMAVGLHGHPVVLAVDGVRRHKSTIPVQLADKWHIGSVTKSITATMVGKLVEENQLQFDATLPDLLPGVDMHSSWSECTLEHLLTHTSGLPANFPMKTQKIDPPTDGELVQARHDLIEEILLKPPRSACDSVFLYSNVGYTVVGHIAESRTNCCYEKLVEKRFFDVCALGSAGFGPPKGDGPDDQPMGHHALFWYRKAVNPFKGKADNTPVLSAAGRAHMNLEDLVAYGRMHLDGELGADSFLQAETWQRLHKPLLDDYAYGWVNGEHDWAGGSLIWHNGSNTMWYALLMLIPSKNAVLAFVTNDGAIRKAEKAFNDAAKQIVRQLS